MEHKLLTEIISRLDRIEKAHEQSSQEINARLTRIETMLAGLVNPGQGIAAGDKGRLAAECMLKYGPRSKELKALMKQFNGEPLPPLNKMTKA
jgi:hypothetical protein